jgi:hypothetical protein
MLAEGNYSRKMPSEESELKTRPYCDVTDIHHLVAVDQCRMLTVQATGKSCSSRFLSSNPSSITAMYTHIQPITATLLSWGLDNLIYLKERKQFIDIMILPFTFEIGLGYKKQQLPEELYQRSITATFSQSNLLIHMPTQLLTLIG